MYELNKERIKKRHSYFTLYKKCEQIFKIRDISKKQTKLPLLNVEDQEVNLIIVLTDIIDYIEKLIEYDINEICTTIVNIAANTFDDANMIKVIVFVTERVWAYAIVYHVYKRNKIWYNYNSKANITKMGKKQKYAICGEILDNYFLYRDLTEFVEKRWKEFDKIRLASRERWNELITYT